MFEMTPPSPFEPKEGEEVDLSAGSSHSISSTPAIRLSSSSSLASGMQNSVPSMPSTTPLKSLSKRNMNKNMFNALAQDEGTQGSVAASDDGDSKCSNKLSSSVHSNCSITDPSTVSAVEPMTPFPSDIEDKDSSNKPSFGAPNDHIPNKRDKTPRTPRSVGAKISNRVTKFDANPLDGTLLSPMQMHASAPSISIAVPPLTLASGDDEEMPLSPMHVRKSVPSKKRSVRHKKIEDKAQMFDSPTPQNRSAARVLLSPQEVRELIKSSKTNHRLDQLLYRYEHLSEEESKERRRLAAKISAKERRRRLGATTGNSEARRLAWETSRAKFRVDSPSGSATMGTDENSDVGDEVFDGVRAISYDFSDFAPQSFSKTEHQRQLILEAVERDFPFAEFREKGKARTDGAMEALIDAFEPIGLPASEVLLHQGIKEGNDKFYILESGTIDVQQEGVSLNQLSRVGESFGLVALMYHTTSNVTFSVALSSQDQGSEAGARLLRIDQKSYRGLLQKYSQKARKERKDALSQVGILKDLVDGDECLSNKIATVMVRHEYEIDDDLGANEDTTFYIVLSGTMKVSSDDGSFDETLSAGSYFGERSLIESLPSRTTSSTRIIATSSGVCFSIDKKSLERTLGRGRLQNLQDMRKLASTALVKKAKLTRTLREKLTSAITEQRLDGEQKEVWKVEKSQKPALYVVREGSVIVSYKNEESGEECKNEAKAGDTFGHEQVTAVPCSDGTKFRRIGGFTASTLAGKTASIGVLPLEEAGLDGAISVKSTRPPLPSTTNQAKAGLVTKANVPTPKRVLLESPAIQLRKKLRDAVHDNLTLDQLEKIRLLGEGEFGEVWLVAADVFQTGVPELRQEFALKSQLRKDDSRGKDASADILREIQLLKEVDHPQVVDLVTTFEDEEAIHILMGLIPGGELWGLIHREDEDGNWKSGMPEEHAKFVTMVLADTLDFIHSREIVFRDLKPENVMIDADGYPVLVDFGCSKYCPDKTFTFVGTPNYVAPEIITNAGHNRCVDYWALGVTVYEMMTGENPFYFDGMDHASLYHAICEEKYFPLSEGSSSQLVDFLDRLLEKNPTQRLGMLAKGVDDIFEHTWLQGLDLAHIRAKQWNAPWSAPQSDDKDSEDIILQKLGMSILTPPLDDSMSRDVSNTDDSTASLVDPSDRDPSMRSIREEDDLSVASLVEDMPKGKQADKKKKKARKKKSSDGIKKKKMFDPASEYRFVTPTTVTYYSIKKPTRNLAKLAKAKAESFSRRSALKGTLKDLGVDSDDDDLHNYLAQKSNSG